MLRFSSCQAPFAELFCKALTAFIGTKLSIPTEFVGDIPWQERERLLDRGDIHVCWICGLPYVRKNNGEKKTVELLAAAVMRHPRYGGRPVYYSDVVVRAASDIYDFEDLRGRTWAYNEPGSHSGHNVTRYHLAKEGLGADYFGCVIESGSHQNSLRMLLEGVIDATAIDSTVLEMALVKDRSLGDRIRTITILGPSPAPPGSSIFLFPAISGKRCATSFFRWERTPTVSGCWKTPGCCDSSAYRMTNTIQFVKWSAWLSV